MIGGVVARDPALPELEGDYLFTDYCKGNLRALSENARGQLTARGIGLNVVNPTSITNGRHGRIYVSSKDGGVYRIKPG